MIKITLIFSKDFEIDTIALFDTGADLNCIKEDIVPRKFHEKTKERLFAANNSKLKIKSKVDASVHNNGFEFRTSFLLTNDIHHTVILGTPFINLIIPYTVNYDSISFKAKNKKLIFPFIEKSKTRNLNIVKTCSVYQNQIIAILKSKQNNLFCLQKNLSLQKIESQLQNDFIQKKISNLKIFIEKEIWADLPSAFWNQKQHLVDLPYETSFDKKQIPTKARPIQMSMELEQHCKNEIKDLESKDLIVKSRSPWSCAAFYVNKNSEIARGTPRLVINYKPINKALKWIRYPIPNKKDLIQKLHSALIFLKFDMKSGFWQIQIHPKDRYKTAFIVPFG